MRSDDNNLRMTLKSALDNLWSRITDILGTVKTRVTDLEDAMDDIEGDMIKSITFNGTAVPKDAQGNVALQETDPTVPAWAKQVKAKTSDFTNDGADGVHPYISQGDVTVPTKTSDLLNDGDDGTTYYVTWRQLSDSKDQAFIDENYIELTQDNIRREFTKDEHYQGEAFFMYASPAGLTAMLPNGSQYTRYTNCTFRGLVYTNKQYMTLDDYNMVGWMEGPGIHELVTGYIDTDWSDEDPTIYITEITQIGGSGSGGDVNIIEAISFNGTNVPPDAGKRVSLTETDPTVPAWAKAASKPTYTAQEVGALPSGNYTMGAAASSGLNRMFNRVDITKPDNDVSGSLQMGQLLTAMDKNSRLFFSVRATASGTGNVEMHIGFYNHDGSDTIGTYGRAEIAKDGTVTFTFSHPTEIREALDIVEATTAKAGLMSAADKTKLDGAVAKSGDTMTGTLKWANGTALPAASSLQYFLGIDAFADGGTTHYITAANLLTAIGAVNNKTDITRRFQSGSVNDAPLGLAAYSGAYSTVTDKPYNNWFDVFTFKSDETNYTRQIAVPWFNNRSIAFRVQSNGTWASWRYIATQTTEPTA